MLRDKNQLASDSEDLYGRGDNYLDFIDQVKANSSEFDKKLLKRLIDTQTGAASDPGKSFKFN